MKKGTIWCWIFGHRFTSWSKRNEKGQLVEGYSFRHRYDWCQRCGLTKEEIGL